MREIEPAAVVAWIIIGAIALAIIFKVVKLSFNLINFVKDGLF